MSSYLPTGSFAEWNVTGFRDSLLLTLKKDRQRGDAKLRLYFYAVTIRGWQEIRKDIRRWMKFDECRRVIAYVGTDHAVTDPNGLEAMCSDGVSVRIMENYRGVFHPKVVWLDRATQCCVWIGSNNLTRDGLLNNIEFAVTIQSDGAPKEMRRWARKVHAGSVESSLDKIKSYRLERRRFEKESAESNTTTFTWSLKREPSVRKPDVVAGDLVMEVMPKETGAGGKQIQVPIPAAKEFFGVEDFKEITLFEKDARRSKRKLRLTLFPNRTVRLVINELEYGDRPCLIVFHKVRPNRYSFEIVSRSILPARYRRLLRGCDRQTRSKSKRWGIIS